MLSAFILYFNTENIHNADLIDAVHASAKEPIKKEGPVIKTPVSPTKSALGSPSKIRLSNFLNLVKNSKEMASVFLQVVFMSFYVFCILVFFQDLCYTGPVGSLILLS